MKFRGVRWLLASSLLGLAEAEAAQDGSNPLQKVIQLMTELQGKVIADGEQEAKAYSDFTNWCGQSAGQTQQDISDGEALKEELQARIEKATSDAEQASTQISSLTGSIATDEADMKAATLLRQKERQDFQGLDQELTSTIDTLSRAQKLLASQLKDAGIAKASFLQKPTRGLALFRQTMSEVVNAATMFSEDDRAKVAVLLHETDGADEGDDSEDDDDAPGAPAGSVYSSRSSGVLEAIKLMQQKAEQALNDARKQETNQRMNFESFAQSLTAKIAGEKKDLEGTKSDMARANEIQATTTNELDACVKGLKEDKQSLAQLQNNCMNRATEFAEEMRTRDAELKALATAKKAIQDSSQSAEQQAYGFAQVASHQHRSRARLARMARAADEEMRKLRTLAKRTGSLALAQLASRITAAFRRGRGDPFEKVRGLIENMVYKLEREQKGEATQNKFCDQEKTHTKQTKESRSDDVEEMTARLDSTTAAVARLQEDLKVASNEMLSMSKSQNEMDRIRMEEKAAFEKTSGDLKEGLSGLQRALSILRDYYGGGPPAAELLQEDVAASMAQEAQQKRARQPGGGAGGGIIGLLEVVEADFAKSLTEAQTLESEAADEYDKTTQRNRVTRAELESTVQHKQKETAKLRKSSSQVASDRTAAQQELDAVNEYWAKLETQCSQEQETYADRMEKREAEIKGLQESLATLEAA